MISKNCDRFLLCCSDGSTSENGDHKKLVDLDAVLNVNNPVYL